MPVRTPGSMTQGLTPKCRSDIRRRLAVTLGTTDEMAIPVICCSVGVTPCQPRNWRRRRASSSDVRSATVTIRQWSMRSNSLLSGSGGPKRPATVWVLPTSMASSICVTVLFEVEADVEHRRRVGEGTDGDEIGSGGGVGDHALEGDSARHLDGEGAAGDAHRLGDFVGGHVVDEDE